MNRSPPPDLVLNVAPIELTNGIINGERLSYVDTEKLNELFASTRDTHLIRRDGDSVLCVPISGDSPTLGGEPVEIDLEEDLYITANLVRQTLLAHLHKLGRTILSFRPVSFLASRQEDDYLAMALPAGVENVKLLRVSPVYELDVRVLTPEDQAPYVALTLDVRVSRRILASCHDLISVGVDVRGVYVKRSAEVRDPRVAAKLLTVGQVERIEGEFLHLTDHRENFPAILASEAFPQARSEFFGRCVEAFFPTHAHLILGRIEQEMIRFREGPESLKRLRSVRDYFGKQKFSLPQGITCTIHPFLSTSNKSAQNRFPKLRKARSAVYVFDPAQNVKKCEWPPDNGLNRYGPYSSRGFTPNRPRICVVCQRSKKGQIEQFLTKFRDGMRHESGRAEPFEKGFVNKYNLGDVDFAFFPAENPTADAYKRAVHEALTAGGPTGPKWDLCFVQIERKFRDLPVSQNPYMVCKAAFLTHQVPVQEFTFETAQLAPYQLSYALNNLSLAAYAKMNGTPWLLQSDQPVTQEVVVGLGSARIGDSRLGPGQRVVGITTVFTGDGNYCLANLSGASSYETYQEELLKTLRLAIRQVREDTQWRSDRPVRLVFHLGFKQFCKDEVKAVKQLITELGGFDTEYAFVQLVEEHPYRLFDLAQTGQFDYRTKRQKGAFGPSRGHYLLLSEREVLISLTGFKEVKRPEDGVPRPILIKVHADSTFTDPVYLARQVFAFAGHSWQGFFPCRMPVTVEYSEMIARLLGQLATLPGWDPSALLGRIGWTRWFL
jgi:hypothetical protein